MRRLGGEEWALWLAERGIVALDEIDTRVADAARSATAGAMRAVAVADERTFAVADALEQVRAQPTMEGAALVAQVSTPAPYVAEPEGRVRVAVVDYGVKRSILRRLATAGAAVTVYPHVCDPDELASHDGVLLSNGPGDPAPLVEETEVVRATLGRVPMLGICLGHQLIGLATGHETTKLPFGHRGANHPVLDRRTGPRARHEPEPRLRGRAVRAGRGDARLALRRHRRGLRLPRACARRACSSTPRPGPGRTTPGRSSSAGSRSWSPPDAR